MACHKRETSKRRNGNGLAPHRGNYLAWLLASMTRRDGATFTHQKYLRLTARTLFCTAISQSKNLSLKEILFLIHSILTQMVCHRQGMSWWQKGDDNSST